MHLKDQTEKRAPEQLKIWMLKRIGARKENREVTVSGVGEMHKAVNQLQFNKKIALIKVK